jgi:hypothetical protein
VLHALLGRWETSSWNDRDRLPATVALAEHKRPARIPWPSNAPQAPRRAAPKNLEDPDRDDLHTRAARGARLVHVALHQRAKGRGYQRRAHPPAITRHTRRRTHQTKPHERPARATAGPRLISSPAVTATAATTAARRPRERLSRDQTGSTRGPVTPGLRGPPMRVRPHTRATVHPRHNAPPPAPPLLLKDFQYDVEFPYAFRSPGV